MGGLDHEDSSCGVVELQVSDGGGLFFLFFELCGFGDLQVSDGEGLFFLFFELCGVVLLLQVSDSWNVGGGGGGLSLDAASFELCGVVSGGGGGGVGVDFFLDPGGDFFFFLGGGSGIFFSSSSLLNSRSCQISLLGSSGGRKRSLL